MSHFSKKCKPTFLRREKCKRYVLTFLLFPNNQHVKRGQWWTLSCRQCCAAKKYVLSKLLWRLYPKFLGNWTKRRSNSWFLLTQQFHLHLSGVTSDPDLPGDVWSQNSLKFICQSSSKGDEVPGFPEDYRERECSLIHSASRSAVWYCVLFSLYTEHLGTTLYTRQV